MLPSPGSERVPQRALGERPGMQAGARGHEQWPLYTLTESNWDGRSRHAGHRGGLGRMRRDEQEGSVREGAGSSAELRLLLLLLAGNDRCARVRPLCWIAVHQRTAPTVIIGQAQLKDWSAFAEDVRGKQLATFLQVQRVYMYIVASLQLWPFASPTPRPRQFRSAFWGGCTRFPPVQLQ